MKCFCRSDNGRIAIERPTGLGTYDYQCDNCHRYYRDGLVSKDQRIAFALKQIRGQTIVQPRFYGGATLRRSRQVRRAESFNAECGIQENSEGEWVCGWDADDNFCTGHHCEVCSISLCSPDCGDEYCSRTRSPATEELNECMLCAYPLAEGEEYDSDLDTWVKDGKKIQWKDGNTFSYGAESFGADKAHLPPYFYEGDRRSEFSIIRRNPDGQRTVVATIRKGNASRAQYWRGEEARARRDAKRVMWEATLKERLTQYREPVERKFGKRKDAIEFVFSTLGLTEKDFEAESFGSETWRSKEGEHHWLSMRGGAWCPKCNQAIEPMSDEDYTMMIRRYKNDVCFGAESFSAEDNSYCANCLRAYTYDEEDDAYIMVEEGDEFWTVENYGVLCRECHPDFQHEDSFGNWTRKPHLAVRPYEHEKKAESFAAEECGECGHRMTPKWVEYVCNCGHTEMNPSSISCTNCEGGELEPKWIEYVCGCGNTKGPTDFWSAESFASYDMPISERQRYRIRKLGGRIDKAMNRSDASQYIKSLMAVPLHAETADCPTCQGWGWNEELDIVCDADGCIGGWFIPKKPSLFQRGLESGLGIGAGIAGVALVMGLLGGSAGFAYEEMTKRRD